MLTLNDVEIFLECNFSHLVAYKKFDIYLVLTNPSALCRQRTVLYEDICLGNLVCSSPITKYIVIILNARISFISCYLKHDGVDEVSKPAE